MNITRGRIEKAKKLICYGPEGIGKSTFASKFPDPVFIDTEGSTSSMDVARLPAPTSWQMLLSEVDYIKQERPCKTLVIDTADWAEKLCIKSICDAKHWSGIEDAGYGKGYVYLAEEFGKLLNSLSDVIDIGINVVINAHAKISKFEQPDEMGSYDRWELKMEKKTSPLLKEWADIVLFANYKTYSVATDKEGRKHKAQGGQRVMHTTHHPCWDAKNRQGLPDELPFDFSSISYLFEKTRDDQSMVGVPPQTDTEQPLDAFSKEPEPQIYTEDGPVKDQYEGIPKALADLMRPQNVTREELMKVVAKKGYYTFETPIENYDQDFINGVLIAAWKQVFDEVINERIPF